jgi:glycosyltransferase involved in cell wall biosynthesis
MRFIVFGEDWGAHPSSTQHLFKNLSHDFSVHWINSIGMRKPKVNKSDLKRVVGKARAIFSKGKSVKTENNHCLNKVSNLFVLPWHDNKLVNAINKLLVARQIPTHRDEEPIIYWVSVPTAISLIRLRPQDKLIYYCGDDFSALAGVDHAMVAPHERALIERADLIYVVSNTLKRKMPEYKTVLLTHGVDFGLFNSPCSANVNLTSNKVKLGFYGSINEWLDVELLIELAKQRPDYDIYLVGAVTRYTDAINQLFALQNVTHIKAVAHDALPSFSQHWQVCLMPFIDNEQIRACNPLKLKEYLASGTPIVATNFPAAMQFNEFVLIANDVQGFIDRIDMATAVGELKSLAWRQYQAKVALPHSWKAKAQIVKESLTYLL